jgi:hypothetical protein
MLFDILVYRAELFVQRVAQNGVQRVPAEKKRKRAATTPVCVG